MRDMKPSSIISASRASRASNLGRLGANEDVRNGYGFVQEEDGRNVRCFGVEGNVIQPQKQQAQ